MLGAIIKETCNEEGTHRLKRGMAMRWTHHDSWTSTLSISRQGVQPSNKEIQIMLNHMKEWLPPHTATVFDKLHQQGEHYIRRIEVDWKEELNEAEPYFKEVLSD